MKKYIKASDGSFVSFAKKAKTTFNPVTAACGGKKTVKGAESNGSKDWFKYYTSMTNQELAKAVGIDSADLDEHDRQVEESGYGKVVDHYVAKPEYEEILSEDAYLDVLDNGAIGMTLGDNIHKPMRFYSVPFSEVEELIKQAGDIKGSKKVSKGKNISASYDEYDEDVNLPGRIRHQIAELTGWGEDDIAFAFQQWIYDGGGEYDPDEMPKLFRDDIASDVERGEDIEAKYLGD